MKQVVDDLVVHGAPVLWVGVQDQRNRRAILGVVVIATFKTTFRAVNDNIRHNISYRPICSRALTGSGNVITGNKVRAIVLFI